MSISKIVFNSHFSSSTSVVAACAIVASLTACTDNNNFRLRQVEKGFVAATQKSLSQDLPAAQGADSNEPPFSVTVGEDHKQGFQAAKKIDQKFDLLWVVDNSASMEPSQEKLRKGFANFAAKYMRPNWDIRVAVITTDTYLANKAYADYLARPNSSFSKSSSYLKKLVSSLAAPTALDALFDVPTSSFKDFPRPMDVVPAWGADYAKLLPGLHDGPIASLCYEGDYEHQGDYMNGDAKCSVRETLTKSGQGMSFKYTGPSKCAKPGSGSDESATRQCVNTVLNNTVHSGKAILSTMPPVGTPADAAWSQGLLNDFIVNVSVSTAGAGNERGFNSVLQLLTDNEASETAFFRADSKRMIVFLSDEEDQSVELPSSVPADFEPETLVQKDCERTLEGHKYTVPKCAKDSAILPVEKVKNDLDRFFLGLDKKSQNPNYAVTAIVGKKWSTVYKLHGGKSNGSQDQGARYLKLVEQVGNGSLSMDIGEADYSPILDQIGKAISQGFRTFSPIAAPADLSTLIVKIVHENKSETIVPTGSYKLVGDTLTITDDAIVNTLQSTDQLVTESSAKKLDTFTLKRAPAPGETVTVQLIHASGGAQTLTEAQYKITGDSLRIVDSALVKKLLPTDALLVKFQATRLSHFTIDHAPETGEKLTVILRHGDGSQESLSNLQYKIEGQNLKIVDKALIARFVESDKIIIRYELKLLNHFGLDRTPTGKEDMSVKLVRADGSEQILNADQYEIREKTLVITDSVIASSLTAEDQVLVNYQPKFVYEGQQ